MNQNSVLLKHELMLGREITDKTLAPNSAAIRSQRDKSSIHRRGLEGWLRL